MYFDAILLVRYSTSPLVSKSVSQLVNVSAIDLVHHDQAILVTVARKDLGSRLDMGYLISPVKDEIHMWRLRHDQFEFSARI